MEPLPPRTLLVAFARRAAVVVTAAGAVLAAGTAVAAAHVEVSAPDAAAGGYTVLTFQVPSESATANTSALTVSLPSDTPIASVSVEPVPGWSIAAPEKPLAKPLTTDDGQVTSAVTEVTWTATAGGLTPGQFAEFRLAVGPLPDTDHLVFPAVQSYSDGTEVDWVETAAAGSNVEPEHPAPTLTLAAAADTDHHGASSGSTATVAASTSDDSDGNSALATTGVVLGGLGLLLGAAALAVALRTRSRRPAGTPTT